MIRVFRHWLANGTIEYRNAEGKLIAVCYSPFKYESVTDYRSPPYEPTSPCIYCSALDDKNHDPSLHVNPRLGTIVL